MLNINENTTKFLHNKAISVRRKILNSLHSSGGGHYGGSFSVADILVVLFHCNINIEKDKLILSKGHAAIALYSTLAEINIIDKSKLADYGKLNSGLEGHPDMLVTPGVDFSTGSLGQGLSVGLGMALGMKNTDANVWVILGDGECQEGQIWEAAMLCSRYKIDNIHVVIDFNGAQECGFKFNQTLVQEPLPDAIQKWKAFGWHVMEVDGHNHYELENSFLEALDIKNTPTVTIAKTKKGAGVKLFEENPEMYHCATLTTEEYLLALKDLDIK